MTLPKERLRVLIVEDSPADEYLLRELCQQVGGELVHVGTCNTLESAIIAVRELHPGVVFLDQGLPDSQGLATLIAFREADNTTPVIVLTGLDDIDRALEMLRHGAQDYLVKGQVTPSSLGKSIMYAIERRRSQMEREKLIAELSAALENVKTLSGLIPICASCKKIRDDKGYWQAVETYISQHAAVEFSHGLCPSCLHALYPGYADHALDNDEENLK